ncbi:hypothetical protein RR48_10183 [Papilio machaon]|uniref:Uncharacterized protein n=1 Tax=Papilio machaon TaxID=76193 RepID=A0A194QZN5_PAPMA|nr:hypothetical protein RR48_10183 [Papilio machaon]
MNEETRKEISNTFCAMEKISSDNYSLYFKKLFNYFNENNLNNTQGLKIDYVKEDKTTNFALDFCNIISLTSIYFEDNQSEEIKNIVLNLAGNIFICNNGHENDEGNVLNEHGSTRFSILENYTKLAQYFSSIFHKTKNCYEQCNKSPVLLPITTYFSSGTTDLSGNERNKQILTTLLQKIDQTKDVAKAFKKHSISSDIEKFINACVTLSENLKKITEQSEEGRTCLCEGKCETCGCVHNDEENNEDVNDKVEEDNTIKDEIEKKIKSESKIVNMATESSAGYFERKVKTSKIKRFTNRDGTVREEIETTIVTEKIHDPVGDIVDIDRDDDMDLEEEEV